MEIKIKNSFNRSTKKIKNKPIIKEIENIIKNLKQVNLISEVKGIQSLAGKKRIYRIKTKELKNL